MGWFSRKKRQKIEAPSESLAMLTAKVRAIRPISPAYIEPLETFSSFSFFYFSTMIIVIVFLLMGKTYYLDTMRVTSLVICIVIYYLMSRSLRNALTIEPFHIPEYASTDLTLRDAFARVTEGDQPVRKIHADIMNQYLKAAYPEP